jgi:hypothetical protein
MAYEFEAAVSDTDFPKIPGYFEETGRIYHLLPNDPVFINFQSVVTDPNSKDIGIDTKDFVPHQPDLDHVKMLPIGLLRVCFADLQIDGFIVDLRYARQLKQRVLGFDGGEVNEEIAQQNKEVKTVPPLGVIFNGMKPGSLDLRSRKGMWLTLRPDAEALAEFVDTERRKRGISVHGAAANDTPIEHSAQEASRASE